MKETRTAKGGPECPTLLHYVARVLIRTDPSLTLFIDEMPSMESAARSKFHSALQLPGRVVIHLSVSFPTLRQNVQSLVASLDKVTEEINMLKQIRIPSDNDQFIAVMQVILLNLNWVRYLRCPTNTSRFPSLWRKALRRLRTWLRSLKQTCEHSFLIMARTSIRQRGQSRMTSLGWFAHFHHPYRYTLSYFP